MNVGDYVRTKRDGIGKIISFSYQEEDECCFIELSNRRTGIKQFNIIKSSPNIIDLIEKSDLVVDNYGNVYVVDYVFDNYIYTTTKQGNIVKTLCDYQIKSIVTKEQFSQMEYKVGE